MKPRTVLLLAGAVVALSTAALAMASGGPQAESKAATSGPAKAGENRSEAEKRAARRAANEQRQKAQGADSSNPAPREEEEEEARKP